MLIPGKLYRIRESYFKTLDYHQYCIDLCTPGSPDHVFLGKSDILFFVEQRRIQRDVENADYKSYYLVFLFGGLLVQTMVDDSYLQIFQKISENH
jgi:hypothetical protein